MKTLIVSISAKNIHKSLAAWCLKAYCAQRNIQAVEILEVNINDNIGEVIAKIYAHRPDVLAFSCYIWNIDTIKKIGATLKKLHPCKIVLGGPEVSFETDLTAYPFADHLIKGEGEKAFCDLLESLTNNAPNILPLINGCNEDFSKLPNPFTKAYFNSFQHDQIPLIQNRLIYYESARGCPFSCSYCLSSAHKGVQELPLARVKADLIQLTQQGAQCIKFIDRTFNANANRAQDILEFIAALDTNCTFHFEVAADLFNTALFKTVQKLPVGRVQFEIGVQSVNPKTLSAINRKTDTDKALHNIARLSSLQNCHIHADLIAGLPHETLNTFADALNRLITAAPHAVQLGFLKMLKGASVKAQANSFGAVYADFAPYEVYKTDTLSFSQISALKKIEAVIERFYNSKMFFYSVAYGIKICKTPYRFFEDLAEFCGLHTSFNFKVSLKNAYALLHDFLAQRGNPTEAAHYIKLDCLSSDPRGLLPDSITPNRNKQAELSHRKNLPKFAAFRIEYFAFDQTHKLFNYQTKHPVTNRYDFYTV
ncbi:MAG: B12-binding domain-containing radical SAM protein [Firmicutes bacterium]|nr:B12-binding domain-containing radical SAM protein [Bacillota bacterium]